ncbi:MAG: hypothetical protein JSV21_01730 [Nitrospirota bacterium]|nr:MAG: hypothetical protein JSV21_01730 [Nitrospirota bacterium]
MLYLGHFTFVEYDEGGFDHGNFTAVVNADEIDTATVKFHSLLDRKRQESGLFDKYTFIFLDNIIEVKHLPDNGFIANHTHYEGEPPPSVSVPLPNVPEELCEAYRPYPLFDELEDSEEVDIVPFMTIEK